MGVLDLAKKLNKEFSDDKLFITSDVVPTYERLRSGAVGLDLPLGGGLPLGRVAVFAGKEHSGKSTVAALQLAAYQRAFPDRICVYADLEHSLDIPFQVKMNGIDPTKMLYMNPTTLSGEQILDSILELQKEPDIGLIVIDSIPALLPGKALENDLEKDMGKQGTIAKTLHRFLNTIVPMINKANNILILVNQVRVTGSLPNGMVIYGEPGGDAPKYLASVKVRFGTRTFTRNGEELKSSDGEGADGFRLKFSVTKNKCFSTKYGGGFINYRYDTGLDSMHDLLEVALAFDFIKRINNVTYALINLSTGEVINDEFGKPLQAKKAVLFEYLETHPEFKAKYTEMLIDYINTGTCENSLLSDEDMLLIKHEEKSVEGVYADEIMKQKILSDAENR